MRIIGTIRSRLTTSKVEFLQEKQQMLIIGDYNVIGLGYDYLKPEVFFMQSLNASFLTGPRRQDPIRIVQFGEGVFLRGFIDWIFEKLRQGGHWQGGIAVVQPIAQGRVAELAQAEGLYTLLLRGIEQGEIQSEQTIITNLQEFIDPYADFKAFLNLAELDSLQAVVSNTTEAGIAYDASCRLSDQPAASYPAKLTQFLYQRYQSCQGDPARGLTILPCELIESNGTRLKEYVLRHADDWQLTHDFSVWLNQSCRFCNTLVDRIVTGYPRLEIDELQKKAGYQDNFFDTAEYFHLWVIEGQADPALPFEKSGLNVIWTDKLSRYRDRKVAILNGAHTMTFAAALLCGQPTVRQALEDKDLAAFLRQGLFDEIIPILPMDRQEAEAYAAAVLERFANPFIEHQWSSIALNAVSKYKVRVLPSLLAYADRFKSVPGHLAFSLAALLLYYRGHDTLQPQDGEVEMAAFAKVWQQFADRSVDLQDLVEDLLGQNKLWDTDLNRIPGLAAAVTAALRQQMQLGMRKAVQDIVG